jgi:hypothetical protein
VVVRRRRENSFLVQFLPAGTKAPPANGAFRAMGVPGIDETLEVGFAAALVGQPEK